MKFKFASFAPLVAACAVITAPVAAFAQTTTPNSTSYPRTNIPQTYPDMPQSPNSYPRTNIPQTYPDMPQSPNSYPQTQNPTSYPQNTNQNPTSYPEQNPNTYPK